MKFLSFIFIALLPTVVFAQLRPIASSVELHLGSASVRNTYLAPLLYQGSDLSIGYERARDWRTNPWASLQTLIGQFTMGEDKGAHSENWSGRIRYRYAAHYNWELPYDDLKLGVGPYAGTEVGFDYNLKMASGNNPATARAVANAGISMLASYEYQLPRLRDHHGVLNLLIQAPLLGYALMPEYGASYYESFLLNNAGNKHHFTSLHNQQDLDVKLTTDFNLSKNAAAGALRLGVGYHIETMAINGIHTRFSSFEAIVGWTFRSVPYSNITKSVRACEIIEL